MKPVSRTEGRPGLEEVVSEHPAFGVVTLGRGHAGPPGARLFGSELRHHEVMTVTVSEASVARTLNEDRTREGKLIASFEFTLAQWAQFVASAGMGAGTPCTLNLYREGLLVQAPPIDGPDEAHLDKFRREMKESIDERTRGILAQIAVLEQALEQGGGKGRMREALREARRHAEQLPGSVDFVNRQFAESVEHIVSDAKTEIEGFVAGVALRTGIKALADAAPDLGALEAPKARRRAVT